MRQRQWAGMVAMVLVLLLGTGSSVRADLGDLLITFPKPNSQADGFGYSIAALGGNVLAGAPNDDNAGYEAGAAYLSNGTTGALLQTFQQPSPSVHDFLGFSVAGVGGNRAAVGAIYRGGDRAGAVYLFDCDTGEVVRSWDGAGNLGYSVAGFGNNVLVGATNETGVGEAYLFNGDTGALMTTFRDPAPATHGCFGYSITGVGENVLVGAPYGGAAYLFAAATGDLLRTFPSPNTPGSDYFGMSVASAGANLLVGAPLDDTGATDAGAAYLYSATTGALLRGFPNPDPAESDHFGVRVAWVGDDVLVGAPLDDAAGIDTGAAYLLNGATGDLLAAFYDPTPMANDYFGNAVAALGNNVLVAAHGNDGEAVYLFEGVPEPATLGLLAAGLGVLVARRRKA